MYCFSESRCVSFAAVASMFFTLSTVLPDVAVAADSGTPDRVNWTWPLVNVGPQAVDTVHTYNTVDTLNASWTSNLDYNPFLIVWCQAPGGFTANQSGSVPPSGWHLVPLNLGLTTPYPIRCHFSFDDQNHQALTASSANSGAFNISNLADNNPKVFGVSTSAAAATTASATSAAPAGATTVILQESSTSSSSGINGGAIAGIVIGVILLIGIVVGVLVFFCIRRRRRERRSHEERPRMGMARQEAEGHNSPVRAYFGGELEGEEQRGQAELPPESKPAEMAAEEEDEKKGPAELEGEDDTGREIPRKNLSTR